MKKIDRTGETGVNTKGMAMKIIAYQNNKKIMVEFEDGSLKETTYLKFRRGKVYPPKYTNTQYLGLNEPCEDYITTEEKSQLNAVALALATGLTIVGVSVMGGIVYAIVKVVEAVF